jgi:hypothetical protein
VKQKAGIHIIDNPRVFTDPLAVRVIGAESALALQADLQKYNVLPGAVFLRAFITARSRYTEEELDAAVVRGSGFSDQVLLHLRQVP